MEAMGQLTATVGYSHFGAVFSTVFPLAVLILILVWYVLIARQRP
jgi:hypothetical protein